MGSECVEIAKQSGEQPASSSKEASWHQVCLVQPALANGGHGKGPGGPCGKHAIEGTPTDILSIGGLQNGSAMSDQDRELRLQKNNTEGEKHISPLHLARHRPPLHGRLSAGYAVATTMQTLRREKGTVRAETGFWPETVHKRRDGSGPWPAAVLSLRPLDGSSCSHEAPAPPTMYAYRLRIRPSTFRYFFSAMTTFGIRKPLVPCSRLLSLALFGFDIDTICTSIAWLKALSELSGPLDENWNLALGIVVSSCVGVIGNAGLSWYSLACWLDPEDGQSSFRIGVASSLQVTVAAMLWVGVSRHGLTEALRAAGCADDAYHVDTFRLFEEVAMILWSVLAGICAIVALAKTWMAVRKAVRESQFSEEYHDRNADA